jgi:hypothetical protein|tara:strand:+ start:1202 stop:2023 length:822 start_codon:yes stop_codon:yes gene_type:complete
MRTRTQIPPEATKLPEAAEAAEAAEVRDVKHRVTWIDWLMLLLAVFSVCLLVWEMVADLPAGTVRNIVIIDTALCAVFLAEFVYRWRKNGGGWSFVAKNWYEILGMIPVAHPLLRGFRLIRLARIVVILSRFGHAADRAFGEEFTYRLVKRFTDAIINAIKRPLTIAMLGEVADVMAYGKFTQNVGRALELHDVELRNMIQEKLRADSRAGRLSRLPFYDDLVQATVDSALHVVQQVLHDPRTDALVATLLKENIDQIRAELAGRELRERGRD